MNSYIVFFTLLTVMVFGFGFAYYYFEKPAIQNSEESSNISILVTNENNKQIEANYYIFSNGNLVQQGETIENGFVQTQLNGNTSILLFIDKPGYYSFKKYFYLNDISLVREEIQLTRIGNLTTDFYGSLYSNSLIVALSKQGEVRNLICCVRWSSNIISVLVKDQELLTNFKSDRFFTDKCYQIEEFYESTKLYIDVKRMGDLTNADFVKLYFIDGDELPSKLDQISYTKTNDTQREDIFMKDLELLINK
jgi:hypothetical protein